MKRSVNHCLNILSLAMLALAAAFVLPSCSLVEKPENGGPSPLEQIVVKLGDVGLNFAVATGKVKEGDLVTIGKGVAIIRSEDSLIHKIVSLADLGIDEVVQRGKLKEGDVLHIEAGRAILSHPQPEVVPPVNTQSSK